MRQHYTLPMQKLDAMVRNSLADRVFTAARVRLMLEALARQTKDESVSGCQIRQPGRRNLNQIGFERSVRACHDE